MVRGTWASLSESGAHVDGSWSRRVSRSATASCSDSRRRQCSACQSQAVRPILTCLFLTDKAWQRLLCAASVVTPAVDLHSEARSTLQASEQSPVPHNTRQNDFDNCPSCPNIAFETVGSETCFPPGHGKSKWFHFERHSQFLQFQKSLSVISSKRHQNHTCPTGSV